MSTRKSQARPSRAKKPRRAGHYRPALREKDEQLLNDQTDAVTIINEFGQEESLDKLLERWKREIIQRQTVYGQRNGRKR